MTCHALCNLLIQQMVLEKPKTVEVETQRMPSMSDVDTGPYRDSENSRLKELILQRDNEISILTSESLFYKMNTLT